VWAISLKTHTSLNPPSILHHPSALHPNIPP
jgi:hypothetical protein